MYLEDRISSCVLKILTSRGQVVGTAFLITPDGVALCCYHVIRNASPDGVVVSVELGGQPMQGIILKELCVPESDIAVIKLNTTTDKLPYVVIGVPQPDTKVRSYGFRSQFTQGYTITGTLRPGQRLVQVGEVWNLETRLPDLSSIIGMSGAPVFEPDREVVVGLVYAEEEAGPSMTYVHPITKIHPLLAERTSLMVRRSEGLDVPASVRTEPPELSYHGLFCMASFQLPYISLIGSSTKGESEYHKGDVICRTSNLPFLLPAEFATNSVPEYHGDDPKCRLLELRHVITGRVYPNVLHLTFSRITYLDYLLSGEFLDHHLPSSPSRTFREKYAPTPDLPDLHTSKLSNICGVGVFIITSDRRIIVSRHSASVRVCPNMWGFAACGTMDWNPRVHLFDEVSRECKEEIGHMLNIEQTLLIAAGVDTKRMYYHFSFVEWSSHTADEILRGAPLARDYGVEVAALRAIPFQLYAILEALKKEEWEPAGAAALLTLCSKEFGIESVEKAIDPVFFSAKSRRELSHEWEMRAQRRGVFAVMSNRFPAYRLEEESARYVDAVTKFLGTDINGKSVLEVGAGNGRLTKWLVERVKQLTCVDISDTMLAENRLRLGKAHVSVEYVHALIQDYTSNHSYDVAICSQVLAHQIGDEMFRNAVENIARHAKILFLFEHVDPTQAVSSFTHIRSEEELLSAFRGYVVARREEYRLFDDSLVFLMLKRE